jgi:hypothetical protein
VQGVQVLAVRIKLLDPTVGTIEPLLALRDALAARAGGGGPAGAGGGSAAGADDAEPPGGGDGGEGSGGEGSGDDGKSVKRAGGKKG